MITTARRVLLLLATSIGIAAVTATPAAAGINLANHCEPLIRPADTSRGPE
jgi:hypothetical protein